MGTLITATEFALGRRCCTPHIFALVEGSGLTTRYRTQVSVSPVRLRMRVVRWTSGWTETSRRTLHQQQSVVLTVPGTHGHRVPPSWRRCRFIERNHSSLGEEILSPRPFLFPNEWPGRGQARNKKYCLPVKRIIFYIIFNGGV